MATGGSIESVTIGGLYYSAATDNDAQLKLGGYEKEIVSNGDGTTRTIMRRVPWMISDLELNCNSDDLRNLQDVQNNPNDVPCTVTLVDGTVYQGTGSVVGELPKSTMNSTVSTGLSGPGELTPQ